MAGGQRGVLAMIGWSCVAEMVTAATLVQHLGVAVQWPVSGGMANES